jgi:hypothetical protein
MFMSTSEKKIAIDIAILPPKEVMDFCIRINKQAEAQHSSWGILAKDESLWVVFCKMILIRCVMW